MSEENNNELKRFRITEVFEIDFFVEAPDYAKAKDIYNKMFDKNIELGYDKWKDVTNKNIKGGTFHVKTLDKGQEATVIDTQWGEAMSMGEEE